MQFVTTVILDDDERAEIDKWLLPSVGLAEDWRGRGGDTAWRTITLMTERQNHTRDVFLRALDVAMLVRKRLTDQATPEFWENLGLPYAEGLTAAKIRQIEHLDKIITTLRHAYAFADNKPLKENHND
jgi:hypothetical protein